jgi:hypothetical protein
MTWTPPDGPAPATNTVRVVATDDGSPVLSVTNVVHIVVIPRLVITHITVRSPGQALLSWQSHAGRTYRVQGRDRAESGIWVDLGEAVTATGPQTEFTDPVGLGTNRIYRVWQLD